MTDIRLIYPSKECEKKHMSTSRNLQNTIQNTMERVDLIGIIIMINGY